MSQLNLIRVGLLCCLVTQFVGAQDNARPNFIIILADDLGFADLSMHGSTHISTPHIDALARSGVSFSQGYVSSSVCAPSRAGLLTGVNQVQFGFDNNLADNQPGFDKTYAGLPTSQITIAKRLNQLGYKTGMIGKWHLGENEQFHPLNRGFDEFWGYLGGGHDYFKSVSGKKGQLAPILCNFKTPESPTYLTDDKGDECVDFIRRHKKEPFFLYASFNAPHAPMQATEADLKLFDHIEDKNRRTYLAMVHRLDVNVGKIIQALSKEGLFENTVVVFLSDNGGPCDQNYSLNTPLRGQKGILLEGGIRVPFVISWPNALPRGLIYERPVSSLDLSPTFLSMAGETFQKDDFTGVDLMPYLTGQLDVNPHKNLMWSFTISTAIRQDDWKLITVPDRLPMLYHLPTDLSEQNNLSIDSIHITRQLLKQVGDWKVNLPHPVFLEGAEWKIRQLELYDVEYQLD